MAQFEILDPADLLPAETATKSPTKGSFELVDPADMRIGPSGYAYYEKGAGAAGPSLTDKAVDVAKSAGVGYLKGATGLAAAPADIPLAIVHGFDNLDSWFRGDTQEQKASRIAERDARALISPQMLEKAGGKAINGYMEEFRGPFHKPQSTLAEYAQTTGEFLPGAALGGGGAVRNALTYGLAPALASETAGQLTRGSSAEPYARAISAIGVGGVGAGITLRCGRAGGGECNA